MFYVVMLQDKYILKRLPGNKKSFSNKDIDAIIMAGNLMVQEESISDFNEQISFTCKCYLTNINFWENNSKISPIKEELNKLKTHLEGLSLYSNGISTEFYELLKYHYRKNNYLQRYKPQELAKHIEEISSQAYKLNHIIKSIEIEKERKGRPKKDYKENFQFSFFYDLCVLFAKYNKDDRPKRNNHMSQVSETTFTFFVSKVVRLIGLNPRKHLISKNLINAISIYNRETHSKNQNQPS